jgi:hypothetical protein
MSSVPGTIEEYASAAPIAEYAMPASTAGGTSPPISAEVDVPPVAPIPRQFFELSALQHFGDVSSSSTPSNHNSGDGSGNGNADIAMNTDMDAMDTDASDLFRSMYDYAAEFGMGGGFDVMNGLDTMGGLSGFDDAAVFDSDGLGAYTEALREMEVHAQGQRIEQQTHVQDGGDHADLDANADADGAGKRAGDGEGAGPHPVAF